MDGFSLYRVGLRCLGEMVCPDFIAASYPSHMDNAQAGCFEYRFILGGYCSSIYALCVRWKISLGGADYLLASLESQRRVV